MTSDYLAFLRSDRYTEILNYTESQMESDHCFIQWLFPTVQASQFNSHAPLLDLKELVYSEQYEFARSKILLSLDKILLHWGIHEDDIDFSRISRLRGHNGLRFSRVLQSLVFHEYENIAEDILTIALNCRQVTFPKCIGETPIWVIRFEEAKTIMKKIKKID